MLQTSKATIFLTFRPLRGRRAEDVSVRRLTAAVLIDGCAARIFRFIL